MPHHRLCRHREHLRRLLDAQPAEEAQLHYLRATRIHRRERGQGIVDNQNLPNVAVHAARENGVALDETLVMHAFDVTQQNWRGRREITLLGNTNVAGFELNVAYGLFDLAETGAKPTPVSEVMVLGLAERQGADGSWPREFDIRPPLTTTTIMSTALALRGLETFAPPGRREEMTARIARAAEFLRRAVPADTSPSMIPSTAKAWTTCCDAARRRNLVRADARVRLSALLRDWFPARTQPVHLNGRDCVGRDRDRLQPAVTAKSVFWRMSRFTRGWPIPCKGVLQVMRANRLIFRLSSGALILMFLGALPSRAWAQTSPEREPAARRLSLADAIARVSAAEARQGARRESDSLLNGALIGAGTAVSIGLFLCTRTEPWENCRDDVGPLLRIGAIGAGIGIAIDALIRRTVTADTADASRLHAAPMVTRRAKGLQIAWAF